MDSRKMVAIECRAIIDEQLAIMTCAHEWRRDKKYGYCCRHCGYSTGTSGDLFELVTKKAKGRKR
jgi:hypothetical protein